MTATELWKDTKFDTWFKNGTAYIFDVQWAAGSFFKTLNAFLGNGKKDKNFNNWFNWRPEEEYEAIIYFIQNELKLEEKTESFKELFGTNIDYLKSKYKKNDTYKNLKGEALLCKVIVDVLEWNIDPQN